MFAQSCSTDERRGSAGAWIGGGGGGDRMVEVGTRDGWMDECGVLGVGMDAVSAAAAAALAQAIQNHLALRALRRVKARWLGLLGWSGASATPNHQCPLKYRTLTCHSPGRKAGGGLQFNCLVV